MRRPGAGVSLGVALGLALVAVACGDSRAPTTVNFVLPGTAAGADYFDLPFPNELRRRADGTIDLDGVPAPNDLAQTYLTEIAQGAGGFGTQSAIYFRLSGPIDPASLPDLAGSTAAGASVQLVDIDPASPGRGERVPLKAAFREAAGLFIGANALILRPYPGFPLRADTVYAALITTALRDAAGRAVEAAPAFAAVRDGRGDETAVAAYGPLRDWLASGSAGVDPKDLAGATVFRTQDPTGMMAKIRAAIYANVPAPTASGVRHTGTQSEVEIFEGTYDGPNFQTGTPPYQVSGGTINVDGSGTPLVVRTENLRFAVTVPKGTMPAAGWPIVLYAHGTGGSYTSFIGEGVGNNLGKVTDGSGAVIAQMATFGIDQVLHGPRDPTGADPDLTFFNFQNLPGARDNVRQGALDNFQLLRLAGNLQVTMPDGTTARFDASRIAFMGHSQGGLTGPPFLGAEPDVRAAVLSGAGANLVLSLLGKTEPVDIPSLVGSLVGEPVDEFHPLLNLVQMYFEPGDPGNYAPLFFRAPPAGQAPKDIFQSLGVVDHYTPIPTIMALAVAMRVQPVAPLIQSVDGMDLAGVTTATAPVTANVAGGATGVLCEYQATTDDGHFVVFDIPEAKAQYARFLATAMRDGRAQLLP
jgi:predicted esterase